MSNQAFYVRGVDRQFILLQIRKQANIFLISRSVWEHNVRLSLDLLSQSMSEYSDTFWTLFSLDPIKYQTSQMTCRQSRRVV